MLPKNFSIGFQTIIRDGDKVLLTKREDFEVWCVPGGGIDAHETFTEAAIRETKEETGLDVRIKRLVGVYSRPSENCYNLAYEAEVVGGEILRVLPREVIEIGWFDHRELPDHTIFFYERMVRDAFEFSQPVGWKLITPMPFVGKTYQEIYAVRDTSGLSRKEFYLRHLGNREECHAIREW